MKLLMFQAKRFWFRTFQRVLETVEEMEVETQVTDAAVIFCHAEAKDETQQSKVLTKTL